MLQVKLELSPVFYLHQDMMMVIIIRVIMIMKLL